jgi:hypothetical protein
MTYVYRHGPPQEDVGSEGKQYSITEGILEYQGRKVLYQYVEALGVSFCTVTGAAYVGNINVKGYVVRWKYGSNEKGEALSEIQPVSDVREQQEIGKLLWPTCGTPRVNFVTETEHVTL